MSAFVVNGFLGDDCRGIVMKVTEYQKMSQVIGESIPIFFRVVPKNFYNTLEVKLETKGHVLPWSAITDVKGNIKRYKSYNAIIYDICRIKNNEHVEIDSVKIEVNFRNVL